MNPVPRVQPLQGLQRLLDEPEVVALVQRMEPRALGALIRQVGLEESGELIAMATPGQLARIFDEDLWRSPEPGREEKFDPERFAVWLAVMLEADPKAAGAKLAAMDPDFVVMALSKYILVMESAALRAEMMGLDEDEERLTEKALESSLNFEFSRHLVIARADDAWDAVLALLVEMDHSQPDQLEQVLGRLARLSRGQAGESGGWYSLLTEAEQLEDDVADAREQRRAEEGFVSPTDAAHFLFLARRADREAIARSLSAKALRIMEKKFQPWGGPGRPGSERLAEWLARQTASDDSGLRLPGNPGQAENVMKIHQAMARLADRHPSLHAQRVMEISYLANVLVAGCRFLDRRFRPFEAAQAAVAVCNLGLECALEDAGAELSALLAEKDGIELFRRGWLLLHTQVAMATAEKLRHALLARVKSALGASAGGAKGKAGKSSLGLAAALDQCLAANKPWEIREPLDLLAPELGVPGVAALQALIAELPVCPEIAGGGQGFRVSSEWIATREQVETAREIGERLLRPLAE